MAGRARKVIGQDPTPGIEDIDVLGGSVLTLAVLQRNTATNAITPAQTTTLTRTPAIVMFKLYGPNGALVDTELASVTGNGSYSNASRPATPCQAPARSSALISGIVSYSGDGVNLPVSDNNDLNGSLTVSAASPTLATAPNTTLVTLGTTAPVLTDSATLAGGYHEHGMLTFTLLALGGRHRGHGERSR